MACLSITTKTLVPEVIFYLLYYSQLDCFIQILQVDTWIVSNLLICVPSTNNSR